MRHGVWEYETARMRFEFLREAHPFELAVCAEEGAELLLRRFEGQVLDEHSRYFDWMEPEEQFLSVPQYDGGGTM